MDQAEQEIRDVQQRWMEAASRKDEPVLDAILGDEYVLISARLGFVDRENWLAMGPEYNIEEFEHVESDIDVYGAPAVSNSRYRQKATFKGQDLSALLPDRCLGQARRTLAGRDPSFKHRPISLSLL